MRLRYIHLSNYPPIKDMAASFSSDSPLKLKCAIHFVVGVNGSGKSNLLRAIAEVFLALTDLRMPQFPVSLVYELGERESAHHRTLILDCEGSRSAATLWLADKYYCPHNATAEQFAQAIEYLRVNPLNPPVGFKSLIAAGDWPSRASTPPLIALPHAVLAYTTGAPQPWQTLWSHRQEMEEDDLVSQDEDYDSSNERPAGWTNAQEVALLASSSAIPIESDSDTSTTEPGTNQNLYRRPILLTPVLLKCALLAVVLKHVFGSTDNIAGNADVHTATPLRQLLVRGGCHHLVSVGFRSRLQAKVWSRTLCETAHDWLLCAGEVIAEPHPTELRRTIFFDLKGEFSGKDVATLIPYDGLNLSSTQGEALWVLLGGDEAPAFELFTKLVELHQAGLFDDVELRLRTQAKPAEDADQSEQDKDIGVLRYEELSDGEQMVLGRMALFHLLRDQQDALLLLDEPETHFNDTWKRDIVGIIDEAIGGTSNDILISTHSAIVLSDVFNDEIVMLHKTAGGPDVRSVSPQTFATDPSVLMTTVFGAKDSIGRRAQDVIEKKLEELKQATVTPAEVSKIKELIERMDKGFYRSELRTLLNRRELSPDLLEIQELIPKLQSDGIKDDMRKVIIRRQKQGEGDA